MQRKLTKQNNHEITEAPFRDNEVQKKKSKIKYFVWKMIQYLGFKAPYANSSIKFRVETVTKGYSMPLYAVPSF